jgi:anaerobic selenocysteine-containing dehydrogenase
MYHPDRVNFPLKRAGERGEGKWQKISWEQALDEVAENLGKVKGKYGAESIAFTLGTGRTFAEHLARFAYLLGSSNFIGSANV